MEQALDLKFLHRFGGTIWNLIANENALVIEIRTTSPKQVSFSALDINANDFYWKERMLEESWWVNASAIIGSHIIFTVYMDTNNPDKKGIVVCSLQDLTLEWWNNDFSLSECGKDYIKGFTSRLGLKEATLEVKTGKEVQIDSFEPIKTESFLKKPVQYTEGIAHFDTVRKFLADRLNFTAVSSLEYLEHAGKIIISCYCAEGEGLANYLFVLSAEGSVLLKEKLDGPLHGIGLDTFFILKGCVIFVRNRVELVSYKII